MFSILQYAFQNSFTYSGRACRKEVWFCWFEVGILNFIFGIILALFIRNLSTTMVDLLIFTFNLIFLPLFIALGVRRLHDLNLSGKLMIAYIVGMLIPILNIIIVLAGFIIFMCAKGDAGENQYGDISPLY